MPECICHMPEHDGATGYRVPGCPVHDVATPAGTRGESHAVSQTGGQEAAAPAGAPSSSHDQKDDGDV